MKFLIEKGADINIKDSDEVGISDYSTEGRLGEFELSKMNQFCTQTFQEACVTLQGHICAAGLPSSFIFLVVFTNTKSISLYSHSCLLY